VRQTAIILVCAAGILLVAVSASYERAAYGRRDAQRAEALTGGEIPAGRVAFSDYGCNSCHTIPGVPDARGLVGPALTGLAEHIYIAGVLANTPANLVLWIRQPTKVNPRTAMPDLGVDEANARNMAAYLYYLK
jgi:cytochrome c2